MLTLSRMSGVEVCMYLSTGDRHHGSRCTFDSTAERQSREQTRTYRYVTCCLRGAPGTGEWVSRSLRSSAARGQQEKKKKERKRERKKERKKERKRKSRSAWNSIPHIPDGWLLECLTYLILPIYDTVMCVSRLSTRSASLKTRLLIWAGRATASAA